MEAHARAPDPLMKGSDMASNWKSWKEDFIIFMKVTGYIYKPNDIRANLLKNRIGKVGIEAIQNISFDNIQDKDDMDILMQKLEEYFNPPKNEVVERYQFFTRSKKQHESIKQYINILREKAKTCNFDDVTESIIRDRIILDTYDKVLREKFFEAKNLDLPKLVAIYNDYNIEKMNQAENRTESTNSQKPSYNNAKGSCWRCGRWHPRGKCFAWRSKCGNCDNFNHFTHCCKSPKIKNDNKINKNLLDSGLLSTQQTKFTPKTNDKWNNQADSLVKTMATSMPNLPDVPTTPCNAANLPVRNKSTSDLIILDVPNTNSKQSSYEEAKLRHNDTTNYSTHLSKTTQYNYSHINKPFICEVKSDEKPDVKSIIPVYNLYNRDDIQPKQMKTVYAANAAPASVNFSQYTEVKSDGKPDVKLNIKPVSDLYNRGGNIQPKQAKTVYAANAAPASVNFSQYAEVKSDGKLDVKPNIKPVSDLYNKGGNIQPKQTKTVYAANAAPASVNFSQYAEVKSDGKPDVKPNIKPVSDLYNKGGNIQPKQTKIVYGANAAPASFNFSQYVEVKSDGKPDVKPNIKPVSDFHNRGGNIQPKQTKTVHAANAAPASVNFSQYAEVKSDGKPDVKPNIKPVSDLYNKGGNIQPKQTKTVHAANAASASVNFSQYAEVKSDGKPDIKPKPVFYLYNRGRNIQPKQTNTLHDANAAPASVNFSRYAASYKALYSTPKFTNKKTKDKDACVLS